MVVPEKLKGSLPPRWFARLVLVLNGAVWLGVGAVGLVSTLWLADILNFKLDGATARSEFRAIYGGLFCAIATLHFVAAIRAKWLVQALTASLVLDIGLVAGRSFSIALDGAPGPVALGLFVGEVLLIGLCGVALWRLGVLARDERRVAKQAEAAELPPQDADAPPPQDADAPPPQDADALPPQDADAPPPQDADSPPTADAPDDTDA
jgi:hypothetical protein